MAGRAFDRARVIENLLFRVGGMRGVRVARGARGVWWERCGGVESGFVVGHAMHHERDARISEPI